MKYVLILVLFASCTSSKYDCAWKQKGYAGYGEAKTGKR